MFDVALLRTRGSCNLLYHVLLSVNVKLTFYLLYSVFGGFVVPVQPGPQFPFAACAV